MINEGLLETYDAILENLYISPFYYWKTFKIFFTTDTQTLYQSLFLWEMVTVDTIREYELLPDAHA